MSLNLLGKRKLSDIESHEYGTLSYSVLCCNQCRNSLIVRRYPDDTYAPICSVEPHCKRCKPYVDCLDKQCRVCCLPESGEPVPLFSDLVSEGVMRVKILELPVSFSAKPCTAMAVSVEPGPASAEPCTAMAVSVEPGPAPAEPCTAMVVAGSSSGDGGAPMLGVRTSSRQGRGKHHSIGFDRQGFFKMVDIYNKFSTRVCEKLFGDDAAAAVAPKFTVQELHKLKTEYDKGAAWTTEEVQELCALPLIMLKAQWKDEHQLSTFREQLTKLMVHISELQQATGKHDREIAALRQAMAALDRVDAGTLLADDDSVSAAGGAGPASFVGNSSTVALLNKNFKQAWSERNELQTRISTLDRALKPRIADQQEQIHKLVQGIGAARICSVDLDTRLKVVEAATSGSASDFDARLKKLEAGPGYTREDFEKLKKEYDVSKPWTEEERAQWDQLPFILRKLQVKLNFNNNLFLRRITKLDQRTVELKQETTELKQALAAEQPAAAGSAVVAAGASVADLDTRLKKLEAGTGHTREDIRRIKAGYDVTQNLTDEEFTQLAGSPLILQKTHWRLHHNIQASWNRINGVKKETAALKQALAAEQQATAELKQALAAEQQATASQAQEIAALKQTLATQGQAVQSMDAHTAQIMQAVQAMMGPMQNELVELRQRVAMLEAARPAGARMAVKKEPKEAA